MVPETKIQEVMIFIINRIRDGLYKEGERLPAERLLAEELHVSRQTIRSALNRLQTGNMIRIAPGSGAYVQGIPVRREVGPGRKRRQSATERTRVREHQEKETSIRSLFPISFYRADPQIAEKMEVQAFSTLLLREKRLFSVNQVAHRIVDSYYVVSLLDRFPEYLDNPLKWLRKYSEQAPNHPEAFECITCRMPDDDEAELLQMNKNQPVFDIERWISAETDIVFGYIHIVANAALHEFTYTYTKANWEDLVDKMLSGS